MREAACFAHTGGQWQAGANRVLFSRPIVNSRRHHHHHPPTPTPLPSAQAALHQRVDNERERRRAAEEALATATAPRGDYDPANDDDDDDGGFEVLEAGGASGAVMRRRGCVDVPVHRVALPRLGTGWAVGAALFKSVRYGALAQGVGDRGKDRSGWAGQWVASTRSDPRLQLLRACFVCVVCLLLFLSVFSATGGRARRMTTAPISRMQGIAANPNVARAAEVCAVFGCVHHGP